MQEKSGYQGNSKLSKKQRRDILEKRYDVLDKEFDTMDKNGDGELTAEEIRTQLVDSVSELTSRRACRATRSSSGCSTKWTRSVTTAESTSKP